MKRVHAYLPATRSAITILGTQIAMARRELGWTAADLAERLGASPQLVGRIERGATSTTIGTVFEAAILCGVPLFGVDPGSLAPLSEHQRARLALLPSRTRTKHAEVSDDF